MLKFKLIMRLKIVIIVVLSVSAGLLGVRHFTHGQSRTRPRIENFRALDHLGNSVELYRNADKRAVVLVTHGNGCPIVRKSVPKLKALRDEFNSDVVFYYLNANPQDERSDVIAEAKDYSIDIPILKDETQSVARGLGFKTTAEVVVLSPGTWQVVYQGAIDDELDYSGSKGRVGHAYLQNALKEIVQSRDVTVPRTEAKGCAIGYDEPPKFSEIAPIFEKRCLSCHARGVEPTNMTSPPQIKGWAAMIRQVLRMRNMPPMMPDPLYGKFQSLNNLSGEESRKLMAWVEAGAPIEVGHEGDKFGLRPRREPRPPNLIMRSREDQIPASGKIRPRSYLLGKVDQDHYVSAIMISNAKPSNAVHHYNLIPLDRDSMFEGNRAMERDGSEYLVVPANRIIVFPKGAAMKLSKGHRLLVQSHYETTGKTEKVQAEVKFWFYRQKVKPKEIHFSWLRNRNIHLKPHSTTSVSTDMILPTDVHLFWLGGHTHMRGKAMRMFAELPGGDKRTLISLPEFIPQKPNAFIFEEPMFLPKGTKITGQFDYDNTRANPLNPDPDQEVFAGEHLENEEMFTQAFFYYR